VKGKKHRAVEKKPLAYREEGGEKNRLEGMRVEESGAAGEKCMRTRS